MRPSRNHFSLLVMLAAAALALVAAGCGSSDSSRKTMRRDGRMGAGQARA